MEQTAIPTHGDARSGATARATSAACAEAGERAREESTEADAPAAIDVRGVSKCFQIYPTPSDRLKQAIFRWRGRKYYREFWALRDVSLTVRRGETVGIIGRNGSGKSTLLQIIAGTLAPTGGSVRTRGSVSALLELGAGFNPDFTGRENVYLAGAIRGFSRRQVTELFGTIAEFADIGDFLDQPVKTYSSGMYVRLAFAVAAQVRPDILVVDEALAVGDVFFQQRCHRFMREDLRGVTKLLVTHDLNSIANHCDRVLVLHHGRASFEGPPLDAIAHYTRLAHTERFSPRSQGDLAGAAGHGAPDGDIPWMSVPKDKTGGAGEVSITRVALTGPDMLPLRTIQPGDHFCCHYEIHAPSPRENLIFGVMISDRFGNAVCGDNSLSLKGERLSAPAAGTYHVRLDYHWPELKPGEYTATFGVGEGLHPTHHTVQCWAHNIVALTAIAPRRPVHGLFTNPVRNIRMTLVG